LAHYNGYIRIDWKRVNQDLELAKKEFSKRKNKEIPNLVNKIQEFAKENVVLATGFVGGFLLGLSSA
jgi:FUN14 domain-containing protein 1